MGKIVCYPICQGEVVIIVKRFIGFILIAIALAASCPAYAQTKEERCAYAVTMQLRIFANRGIEMHISADDPEAKTLRIEYAKLTGPDQIVTKKAVANWKKLGFRHVILTNGERTWNFDVNKLR
jgi:glycerate-2-kinase